MKFENFNPGLSVVTLCLLLFVFSGSSAQTQKEKPSASRNVEIASPEYAELASKALTYLTKLDIDKWASMLADDVEYNFPDGDEGTRTKLTGKAAVQGWWSNWVKTSGIKSMTMDKAVFIPVNSFEKNPSTGLSGVTVISYFSNNMDINGTPLKLRMNFSVHFNKNMLIDRYYTYYDRTQIVALMGKNLLEKKK
jgi:ketosteroid isomerase-like protein